MTQGISVRRRRSRDTYHPMISFEIRRRKKRRTQNTWLAQDEGGDGDSKGRQSFQDPTILPSRSNYFDRTGKWHIHPMPPSDHTPAIGYLTTIPASEESTVLTRSKVKLAPAANLVLVISVATSYAMKGESCRNQSAIKDLQQAKAMYETRTSQRNKRKLSELENSVKEEETQVSDQ